MIEIDNLENILANYFWVLFKNEINESKIIFIINV
jgi:hypothetical protein